VCPSENEISELARILNDSKKTTIIAGGGCAGAHEELTTRGHAESAGRACLRGKEFVEYDNPFDVGMTGLLVFPPAITR